MHTNDIYPYGKLKSCLLESSEKTTSKNAVFLNFAVQQCFEMNEKENHQKNLSTTNVCENVCENV
jgi:hypothetical protein